ncbi:MAG: MarR family winged helix-turn-helix transcriptional regulator [Caldicoprobacterales bacterium]|jgi:DNA-binding MarR family transcriptional regulator
MSITEQFLQQTINFSLLVIEKVIKQLEQTYKSDLTYSEFFAISAVNYLGDMKMTDFADIFGIQKQQATRLINKLVEKGFIKRVYDDSDRRVVMISLTSQAKSYLEEYVAKSIKQIEKSLSGFSDSELQKLQRTMETMSQMLARIDV